ncbi:MAG: toll/interleukin-1 receptor domain-containing protein [Ginsengibacter sp.]
MPEGEDDKFWNLVFKRIEDETCLLIIGPDIAMPGPDKSLNESLREYLQKTSGDTIEYYTEDEFFSFKSKSDKEYAIMDIQEFYKALQPNDLHLKIAEIPFHLIISVSPDHILKTVFDDKKLDYQFAFYNKEQNPGSIQKPDKNRPLIYNLFGDIETDGSLIFTYDDLFNYLIPSTGKFELPMELQRELNKARLVLFLGFRFEKWYFKLLLRLLNLHKDDKLNRATQLKNNSPVGLKNFYVEEFKLDFLQYSEAEIIDKIYNKCKAVLRTKNKPLSTGTEIFISYAWGGESEDIVNRICATLPSKGYNIIRDKIALGFKGNIKKFMEAIGTGKYVIVIISDKYLKSENCMFEMLELQKNKDAYNRIFPIVLTDAKIYEEDKRMDYLIYWDNMVNNLNAKIRTMTNAVGTGEVIEKINQYADIRRMIDGITAMLRSMNTLTPEMHEADNFSELTKALDIQILSDKNK